MTPSHLHLCISMCMYSPFTPQMQISTYLRPDFVCKAIVPTLAPGRTKKKVSGEWWAARRSHVTHIGALPAVSMCSARSMPSDFSAKVLGQGQLKTPSEKKTQWINFSFGRKNVDFWEGFGKLPKKDPQKISKKSEERGSNRTLMNLPGSERSKIQLFQMLETEKPHLSGLEGDPTL